MNKYELKYQEYTFEELEEEMSFVYLELKNLEKQYEILGNVFKKRFCVQKESGE